MFFHRSCLGYQRKRDFSFSLQEWKKPYSSVRLWAQTCRCHRKDWCFSWPCSQPLLCIVSLLMEATGAKTLTMYMSHNWKQAANVGKKKLRVWIPSLEVEERIKKSNNWREFLFQKLLWPMWWVISAKDTAFYAGIPLSFSIYRPRNAWRGWHCPNSKRGTPGTSLSLEETLLLSPPLSSLPTSILSRWLWCHNPRASSC